MQLPDLSVLLATYWPYLVGGVLFYLWYKGKIFTSDPPPDPKKTILEEFKEFMARHATTQADLEQLMRDIFGNKLTPPPKQP